jgi:hypothetical protein
MTLSKAKQRERRNKQQWLSNVSARRARIVGEGGWALSLLLPAPVAVALRSLMADLEQPAVTILSDLVLLRRRQLDARTTSPDGPKSGSR